MKNHIINISQPAAGTPSKALPDGAFAGNGDLTAVLAGSADRVRIHIGKADFWKADGRVYAEHRGGIAPLGLAEILLPQLAYAEYKVEQNLDKACITLQLTEGKLSADLKITVCAEENTILLALDRTYPVVSASISLLPLEGSEAVTETGSAGNVRYAIRGFDAPECRFPSYGICALKQISRTVVEGREQILWVIHVCTNHDSAAYRAQAIEKAAALDETACRRMLADHDAWWKRFWARSSVELPDDKLELYWYAGLYAVACCMRNKKFPPGLWGAYATSDGMGWFGDYHLNYNYQAPFYALTSSNHTELLECYMAPLNDFLPLARQYAREYLGIEGAWFPVGIGPLGLETDYRPDTKEHGHLFLGQKSNGAYAAVIPMMHWYGTRDTEFAKREYYGFLLAVAEFWENYLVFEDGKYQIYNDALNEVGWYAGPEHMPEGHDDKNPVVSRGLVRMLMKLMIDLAGTLGLTPNGFRNGSTSWIICPPPIPLKAVANRSCGGSMAAKKSVNWRWNTSILQDRWAGTSPRICTKRQKIPTKGSVSGTATTGSVPIIPKRHVLGILQKKSPLTSMKLSKNGACPTECSGMTAAVWKTALLSR